MNQPKHQLTKCSKWQREDGVAILIALGIISLVLVIGMGYAFSSYVGAKQSSLVTNVFTARLLADSAVEKAASFIELELAGVPAPHRYFKEGGAGTTWEDRYYVASYSSGASDLEVSQVEVVGHEYIPQGTTDDAVHWTYATVEENRSGDGTSMDTTVIGRQAYAIFDNTGMMDPNVFADPSVVSPTMLGAALGATTTPETPLSNRMRSTADGGLAPASGWASMSMMYRTGVATSAVDADSMAKWTFPYGVEGYEHSFWNDVNGDSIVEPGTEIFDKRNIEQVSGDSAVALYDLFTGYPNNSSRSDASLFSPWLRHVNDAVGDVETARYIAAQTAANIADAADSDSIPRNYYLVAVADNALIARASTDTPPLLYDRQILGTENVHMFAAASLNLFVAYDAAGRDLTITPQASVAVYNPFGTDAFDGEITLEYSFSILSGPTGTNIPTTVSGTVTVDASSMTSTTLAGGDYSASNVSILGSAVFPPPIPPAAPPRDGSYTLNQLVIKSVTVTDGGSVVYDVAPDNQVAVVSTDSLYNWAPGYTHIDGSDYSHYTGISVQAVEPRFNGLNEQHSYAGTYLTTQTAAIVDSALGLPEPPADPPPPLQRHPWDVSAGGDDYDGSEVRDAAFTKLEQLGAVTSGWYYDGLPGSHPIGRSLQFWCRTEGAAATHDGQLLDLFYDGEELEYGKVNVNSPHTAVWEGLLSGVSPSPSQMAETLVNMTDTAPYAGVGEIVQFNNLFLSTLPDSVAEQTNLATIRPLLSVKNQYFTVSATAQSLRDRGAVDISSDADQVEWDSGLYALITGEQKVLAVIYRNLFTNELEVIRYEPLYD